MKRKSVCVFVLLFCLAFTVSVSTVAWLTVTFDFGKPGSIKDGYFAAGDGSEASPFIITDHYHMYNLAWLHVNGFFDDVFPYFRVQRSAADASAATIDMSALTDVNGKQIALPPVGTEAHPFCGQFDGNESTIENLVVSVAAEDISAGGGYDFGSNLGMFGTVKAPADDSGKTTKIYDFDLDGVTVETKTFENAAADDPTPTVGLVAGRADIAAVFEHVGVVKGKITAAAGNKIVSKHSLIGTVGNSSGGGSGDAGGNDLIVDPNAETIPYLPYDGKTFVPVTGAEDGSAYYSTGNSSSNGLAFGTGASDNWYHPYATTNYLELDKNLYTTDGATGRFGKKFPAGDDGSRTYEILTRDVVDKYGKGVSDADGLGLKNQKILTLYNNGLKNDLVEVKPGIKIPKSGVYFRPIRKGTLSALIYVPNPNNFSVGLFKLRRPAGSGSAGTDYSAVDGIERISEFAIQNGNLNSVTAYDAALGYDNALAAGYPKTTPITVNPDPGNDGYYFLFEQDVEAGEEYVIGQSATYRYYQTTFVYMVLPSVNEQGGDGVTGLDFITEGGSMWNEGYEYSGTNAAVTFALDGAAGTDGFAVWFRRDAALTPSVLYFAEGEGVTVTPDEADRCQSSADAKWDAVRTAFDARTAGMLCANKAPPVGVVYMRRRS